MAPVKPPEAVVINRTLRNNAKNFFERTSLKEAIKEPFEWPILPSASECAESEEKRKMPTNDPIYDRTILRTILRIPKLNESATDWTSEELERIIEDYRTRT